MTGGAQTLLPPRLRHIVDAEYPRYSAAEMARRRAAVEAALEAAECDHLVFYGANRAGSVVQWLTQWPVTVEAIGVLIRRASATRCSCNGSITRRSRASSRTRPRLPGAANPPSAPPSRCWSSAARARTASASSAPMTFEQHAALAARFGKIANLNRAYVRLRRVKSAEEIDWLRIGAWLSDRGMAGLRDGLAAGLRPSARSAT